MNRLNIRAGLVLAALILLPHQPASALTLREWRKQTRDEQSLYLIAAISMAANMYAAQGNTTKATCVMDWYVRGKDGYEPTGPHDLALEIGIAERSDPDRYQVEGIILGVIGKVCTR